MTCRYPVAVLVALLVGLGTVVVAADTSEKGVQKGKPAFLGVVLDEVTDEVGADYGVVQGKGALVCEVSGRSPAEKAGLRANDIIVKFDGSPIESPDELRDALREKGPGDVVNLGILRGGKERAVEVSLGSRKSYGHSEYGEGVERHYRKMLKAPKGHKRAYAGIHLQELGEGLAKYFKVDEGVLISDVEEGSPAEKAGLKAGDVIVRIDGDATDDVRDVQRRVRRHEPGETAKFEVVRNGKTKTIKVKLGEQSSRCRQYGFLGRGCWGDRGSFGPGCCKKRQFFGPGGCGHHGSFGPGCGFHSPERRIRVERQIPWGLLDDLEDFDLEIDPEAIKAKVHKLKIDLEPQLEELKEQIRELKRGLEQLKKERVQQKKM